ncbi:hypothetical protein F5Y09DRAFT_318441 [Xylaria sp. FL1042]|nr:hypothetical protein F5Y09DRAFT_318441 [Xylaria sp. FL1042]
MANNTTTYSAEYLAQDRRALVNAFYALPIPLEIISTIYRLIVKASPRSDNKLGYDDYLIVWATITAVAECIAGLVYGPPQGLGRHVQTLKPDSISNYLQGDYIFSHFYDFAIASTKLSILALYHRIFVTTGMRVLIWITAALVLGWLIEMEIILALGCQPIQGWWDQEVAKTARCVDKVAFTYSTNILNLIFDLWIFSMPIPIIMKLQVNKNKRIALCCLFCIGLGVCGLSIARLSVVFSAGSDDITWYEIPFGILSALEPCGAILCANLPIIYRDLVRIFKRLGRSVRGMKNSSSGSKEQLSPYGTSGGQEWVRIDGGGSKRTAGYPRVSATKGNATNSEKEQTIRGVIKVEREFELQSTSSHYSNHDIV